MSTDEKTTADETSERPTVRRTIEAAMSVHAIVTKHAKSLPEEDLKTLFDNTETLAAFLLGFHIAPKSNTGMPCPYCAQTLPRLNIQRVDDDKCNIHISAPSHVTTRHVGVA